MDTAASPIKKKTLPEHLAYFISLIFHPLLLPTFLFALLIFHAPSLVAPWNGDRKFILLGMVFVFTFLLPFTLSFLQFYFDSKHPPAQFLSLDDKRSRVKPFVLSAIIYFAFAYLMHEHLQLNPVIPAIVAGTASSILLSGIISYFWKVSIHGVGAGGVTGFIIVLNEGYADGELFYFVPGIVVLSGLILSARLYLNEHTPSQVLAGWLLGLAASQFVLLCLT